MRACFAFLWRQNVDNFCLFNCAKSLYEIGTSFTGELRIA